jgi:hypothetical protein
VRVRAGAGANNSAARQKQAKTFPMRCSRSRTGQDGLRCRWYRHTSYRGERGRILWHQHGGQHVSCAHKPLQRQVRKRGATAGATISA